MSYKNQQIRVVITRWTLYGTPIPVKKKYWLILLHSPYLTICQTSKKRRKYIINDFPKLKTQRSSGRVKRFLKPNYFKKQRFSSSFLLIPEVNRLVQIYNGVLSRLSSPVS